MPYFEACIWILIGLITGSFVNVCIDRLPLQFAEKELSKLTETYRIKNPNRPLQGNENFPLFEVAIATTLKVMLEMKN